MAEINDKINIFELFKSSIDSIIENKGDEIPINNLLELNVAFLKFSIYCYPAQVEYVNMILHSSSNVCSQQQNPETTFKAENVQSNIVKLLTLPLEGMGLQILGMEDYPALMGYLPYQARKQVSIKICEAVIHRKQVLNTKEITKQLMAFLKPLITEEDEDETEEQDPYEFEMEQQLIARIVHLVQAEDDVQTEFSILKIFKKKFLQGTNSEKIKSKR